MSQEKISYITSDENKKPENQIKSFDVNQMIP
jgi:hypothetical protein